MPTFSHCYQVIGSFAIWISHPQKNWCEGFFIGAKRLSGGSTVCLLLWLQEEPHTLETFGCLYYSGNSTNYWSFLTQQIDFGASHRQWMAKTQTEFVFLNEVIYLIKF